MAAIGWRFPSSTDHLPLCVRADRGQPSSDPVYVRLEIVPVDVRAQQRSPIGIPPRRQRIKRMGKYR